MIALMAVVVMEFMSGSGCTFEELIQMIEENLELAEDMRNQVQ
jgi:hypothetical protein